MRPRRRSGLRGPITRGPTPDSQWQAGGWLRRRGLRRPRRNQERGRVPRRTLRRSCARLPSAGLGPSHLTSGGSKTLQRRPSQLVGRSAAQTSNSSAAHNGQYRPTSASGPVVAYIRQRSFGSVQSRSHSRQRRSVEVATWRFSLSMASFSAKSASDPPRPMASPRSQDVGLGRPSAERPRAGLSAILRAPAEKWPSG